MTSNLPTLPAEWEWKTLGNCFVVKDGTHDSPKFFTTGYPLYTSKNLSEKGLDNSNFKYISDDDYHKINLRSKVDYGDLLFAMIGTIGNPTIVDFEPNFAIKNMALFKPKDENSSIEYLKYYLLSNTVIDKMISESNGATQKFVGLGYLRAFLIPLPPLDEQKRLVSLLGTLFAKIDRSIELLSKNITAADALLPSALNTVFGELGEKFEKKTLKDMVEILGDGLHGTPIYDENGDYYFINGANLIDGKIVIKENTKKISVIEYEKYKKNLNSTTVLVSINGTIGNVALFNDEKCILGKSACFFNLKKDVDKVFMTYVIKNNHFQTYIRENATGSTISNVSLKTMREYRFPLPPLDIQIQTVEYLDSIRHKVEILKRIQNDKITHLKALKASLLDRAFKGEL